MRKCIYNRLWEVVLFATFALLPATYAAERSLSVGNMSVARGETNCLTVLLEAQGDENAVGFSLNFDPSQVTYVSASKGSDAASAPFFIVNTNQLAAGRIGFALTLLFGNSFPQGSLSLVEVCFQAKPGGASTTTPITMGDTPTGREISDPFATPLPTTFNGGTVTITGGCAYALGTNSASFLANGGSDTIAVNADSGCAWTVDNTNAWITLTSGASGTGNGTVNYSVAANLSSAARVGTLVIADQLFTVNQAGLPCVYVLTPPAGNHPAAEDTGSLTVTTTDGCAWTVANTNAWVTITSGASGTGIGTVNYTVAANQQTVSRSGSLVIGGVVFTLNQAAAPCAYTLNPTNANHGAGADSGQFEVTTTAQCSWSVVNPNAWITITSATSGTGNGTVMYEVAANTNPGARTGTLTVGDQTFSVLQAGAGCAYTLSPTNRTHGHGATTGLVSVVTSSTCDWSVENTNAWITITSATNGTGAADVEYAITANPTIHDRLGVVIIGGQPFALTQLGLPCEYSLSPTSRTHGYGSAANTATLSTLADCPWTIENTNDWITVTSATNGTGSVEISYSVASNPTSFERTGSIVVEGAVLTLTQRARPCSYSLSPTEQTHGAAATTGQVDLTAVIGCSWTIENTNAWITITSPTSGTNSATVNYSVAENTSVGPRTAVVLIADQLYTINQAGIGCTYALNPANANHGSDAASGQFDLTTTAQCSWNVVNSNAWITVTSATSGTGSSTISYDVAANIDASARTGSLTVGEQTFTIIQAGAGCAYTLSPTNRTHGHGATTGLVSVVTSSACDWSVENTNAWITITSATNGTGVADVAYAITANPTIHDRLGVVVIGGQSFVVTQLGIPCEYTLSPTSRTHGYGSAANTITLATLADCPWTIENTNDWITITSATNGTSSAEISYSVASNPASFERTGSIVVDGAVLTLTQRARPCSYSLSPTEQTHGAAATTGQVDLTAVIGCSWSIENTNAWITITSPTNGTGSAAVNYSVAENTSAEPRTAVVLIADQFYTINQAGIGCTYALNPASANHGSDAASGQFDLTTTAQCSWNVVNSNAWITVTSATSGTGSSTISYDVAANTDTSARTGSLTVGEQTFTIIQAGAGCAYTLSPTNRTHGHGATTGLVSVVTGSTCDWTVENTNAWITITSATNGTGLADVEYAITENPSIQDRMGVLVIGQQPFTVTQLGIPCDFTLSPTTRTHGYGAKANTFTLTALPDCSWTIVNTNDWITITSATNGTGSAVIDYTIASNPASFERSGAVVVGDATLTITQRARPCSYAISPSSRTHGPAATTGQVDLTAVIGCAWTIENTNDWIAITSATNGDSSATIDYAITENTDAAERTGLVVIADQLFTLTQRGAFCVYEMSPTNQVFGADAASGQMDVLTTANCSWSIVNTNDWITITAGQSGTGNGAVQFDVAANPDLTQRTGSLTIPDDPFAVFTVIQSGAPCAYSIAPTNNVHGTGMETGLVTVTTTSACVWSVVNTNGWITIDTGASGTGSGAVGYTVAANPNALGRIGNLLIAEELFTVSQSGVGCTFVFDPTAAAHGSGSETGAVSVVTGVDCVWTASSTNDWITLLSGASGTGNGIVSYNVATNESPLARAGALMIGGETIPVTQAGTPCTFTLSPTDRTHGFGATTGLIQVATSAECHWSVINTNDWITLTGSTNGTGDGAVSYAIADNPDLTDRTGVIVIGDQAFTLTQLGIVCTYRLSPSDRTHGFGATGGTVTVRTKSVCPWTVVNTNEWIAITSGTNGLGEDTVSYTIEANPAALERTGVVVIAELPFTLTQRAAPCTFAFIPTIADHGAGAETGLVSVVTLTGCSWTVSNTNDWITITSGASGTDSGMVGYTVAANPSSSPRTGLIQIADELFPINQAGAACTYALTPLSAAHGEGMETGWVSVATLSDCDWTATTTNDWITILSGSSGTGSGQVQYAVTANTEFEPRTGVLEIAGQAFQVTQSGLTCTYELTPASASFDLHSATGMVSVTTLTDCRWSVANSNSWISILEGEQGTNSGTIVYAVADNQSDRTRTGQLVIADQVFTVSQTGFTCAYHLATNAAQHTAAAESGSFAVVPAGNWILRTNATGPVDFAARMVAVQQTINGTETNIVFDGLVFDNSVNDLLVRLNPGTLEVGDEIILEGEGREVTRFELEYWGENAQQADFAGAVKGRLRFYANDGSSDLGGYAVPQTVLYDSGWFPVEATPRSTLIFEDFQSDAAIPLTGPVPDSFTWTIQFSGMTPDDSVGVDIYSPPVLGLDYPDFWERGGSGCDWSASSQEDWITLTSEANDAGGSQVRYQVAANPTALERSGTITAAGQTFTVHQAGAPCTFALNPLQRSHGPEADTGQVEVTTLLGCSWTVTNTNTWITITAGASSTNSGGVTYAVDANPDGLERTGTIVIGDQPFLISQAAAPCTFAINPTSQALGHEGGSGQLTVTTLNGCSWTADNTNAWITITAGATGTGSGTVSYTVAANPTGLPRAGVMVVAGNIYTVTQAAAPCTFALSPTERAHGAEAEAGQLTVTTLLGCDWTVGNSSPWVTITGGASGTGSGTVSYTVAANPTALERTAVLTIGDQRFTITQDGAACTFAIDPTNHMHSYTADSGQVSLTTLIGCAWTIINTNDWITLDSEASGTNSSLIDYTVAANPDFEDRTGVLLIAGEPYAVRQAGRPCTATLSPTSRTHGTGEETGQITVTPVGDCAWTVVNTNDWITVTSGAGGTGNGTVEYTVAANEGPQARTGVLVIAETPFTITQPGIICAYTVLPPNAIHGPGEEAAQINVTTSRGCDWQVANTNTWITITSDTNFLGNGTVSYTVAPNPSAILRAGVMVVAHQLFPVLQSGAPCTYAIAPASHTHGPEAENGQVTVTAVNDCTWTVENTNNWITITSGSAGTSSGAVRYALDANPTANARTGVLVIAGLAYTVHQDGAPCTFTLVPANRTHGYQADTGQFDLTTITGCSWTAATTNDWISITSNPNGTDNGTVQYAVEENPDGLARTGAITVDGETFVITQTAAPCTYSLSPTAGSHAYEAATGQVQVTTLRGCEWSVVNTNDWITLLSAASGTGNGTVEYAVDLNWNANGRSGTLVIADLEFPVTQAGAPCTFTLTPTTQLHDAAAGLGQVDVTTVPGCEWSVANTNDWITITSSSNHVGSGTVDYSVAENLTAIPRSGIVAIAGVAFTVQQLGATCTFALTPTNGLFGFEAETGQVDVTTIEGCDWNVINTNTWITIETGATGSGSGSVQISVATNPIPAPRSGVLLIAGQVFPVTQEGAPCVYSIAPTNRLHLGGIEAGVVSVTTSNECNWAVENTNDWIRITSGLAGVGNGSVRYTVAENLSPNARMGIMLIAGEEFAITQLGSPCAYTLLPTERIIDFQSTTGSVGVLTVAECTWSVVNTNEWLTITSATNGIGNGTVDYLVTANPTPNDRSAVVQIADQFFTLNQLGSPCTFALSPTNALHGFDIATGQVNVATLDQCIWAVDNTNNWITITAGANGTGNGTLGYQLAANPSHFERTGVFLVGGEPFFVTQTGAPCTYSLAPTNQMHGPDPESGQFNVTAVLGCTWTVVNTNDWITITSAPNGVSNGRVNYNVAANPSPFVRTGLVSVADQLFTVTQQGITCTYRVSPRQRTHGYGGKSSSINIITISEECPWTVINTNDWIILPSTNGVGNGPLAYSVLPNPNPELRTGFLVVEDQVFTMNQRGFAFTPMEWTHGAGAETGLVTITTCDTCNWTATATNDWITILSATNGTGSGSVTYAVDANPTALPRTGIIVIGEREFTVNQVGAACEITLAPSSRSHGDGVETGQIGVTALTGCEWTVVNTNTWITITSGLSGTNSGTVDYRVDLNPIGSARAGTLLVEDQPFTVTQSGAPCIFTITPMEQTLEPEAGAGQVTVTTLDGCDWTVENTNNWITLTAGANGSGNGTVSYTVAANSASADRTGSLVIAGRVFTVTQRKALFAPAITRQPADQSVVAGTEAAFTVAATGTAPLHYQWRFNDVNLVDDSEVSGATTPTLTLANVQAARAGAYTVLITNLAGSVLSAPATLDLLPEAEEAWRVRYNGPGNGLDEARAIVADDAGNGYVTGVSTGSSSGSDYYTIKYGPNGAPLWSQRYNGTGNGPDYANDITVDAAGNVYVTGESVGGNSDYVTIKYGPDGTQLWVARFSFNHDDSAAKVVVDAVGQVYVTGTAGRNYTTLKYDANGSLLWARHYDGPARDTDRAHGLGVDRSGNVYVTGGATGVTNGMDFTTVKYDPAGNLVWVVTYSGPNQQADEAAALRLDADGNVVIAGSSFGDGTDTDFAVVKYDPDGNQLWAERFDGPANGADGANALGIDADNNIFVSGKTTSAAGNRDWLTLKYDADGHRLWDADFRGPGNDEATALSLDLAGNVYVTGFADAGGHTDYRTIKYTAQGGEAWSATYDFAALDDVATAIAVAGDGHVLVTGRSPGASTSGDYATISYRQNGLPVIGSAPGDLTVLTNQTAVLRVRASGPGPLQYQWRMNEMNLVEGGTISGVHSDTLTLANAREDQTGRYTVVISNPIGSVISPAAQLTVTTETLPPTITREPVGQTVTEGETASFTVEADGTIPFSYQWRLDGNNLVDGAGISGATTATLTLDNVQAAQAGDYTVVVSNPAGSATSGVAVLTVNPRIIAPTITRHPANQNVTEGDTVQFEVEASGTAPFNYQWRFNGSNLADGANVSGATTATLTLANVQLAQAGTYSVVVSNPAGSATSADTALTVNPLIVPPTITRQPAGQSVPAGMTVQFSVAVSGTAPFSYQWRFNGSDLANGAGVSGATTATLTLVNVQAARAGNYSVVVSNPAGSETSANAVLTVRTDLTLAEALDEPSLPWSTDGNALWLPQVDVAHDGVDAARSGVIGDNQQTWLETTVVGPGTLRFWWKVSSQAGRDLLRFYVGGIEQTNISGDVDWQEQAFAIPAGTNVLWWVYVKDYGTAAGQDRGWVDEVSFVPETAPIALSIAVVNDNIVLSWNAIPGRHYRVLYKDNLMDADWTPMPDEILAAEATATWQAPLGTNLQRYFRIEER